VAHTYDTAGTYVATLYADNGCSYDTVGVTITVQSAPPADFSISQGPFCVGTPVQFTNNTPAPAGLSWDFGDGGGSTLSAPTHSYANAGNYDVTLTVTSSLNPCPSTLTLPVEVQVTPTAAITADPASGCIPLDVQFTSSGGDADFHQWSFGDGNTSTGAMVSHTYETAGVDSVRLVAENLNGCTDTAFALITAFPLPQSSFTLAADHSCTSPVDVQLTSTATGAVGHAWEFGNGSGSLLNNPVATYDAPGTYTITLAVTNQYGCADTATAPFTVYPTPMAQFTVVPQPACADYPVQFLDSSLNATAFWWNFGDGTYAVEQSPWHSYPEGSYDVVLVVTGAGNCTDTLSVPDAVLVHPRPVAAFSYTPMQSTSYALQFHNESSGAVSWVWDFGDGETSTDFEPLHLFPAGPDDDYPLCLVAINSFNCPDTLCRPVTATSDPMIFAPNAFTPDEDGVNEEFRPILNGFDDWRYRFYVFDRWGEVIHQSRSRYDAWDGTCKGKPVKSDVYVWKVVLNKNGDERVFYGHVTVVRGTE
jgi:gliding motility-associated-like protein